MLDIGWSELLVVAIVAIVVVGPKDLPKLMRTFGFYAGKLRRTAADFQRQFHEAMAESEAEEVRKNIEAIRSSMGTTADFNAPADKAMMMPTPAPAAIERAIEAPDAPAPKRKPAARKTKPTPKPKPTPKLKSAPKAAPKRRKTKAGPKR
jgi:sec-independent protein translocase protein TatB